MGELKEEIERIRARNARVEADKAWETSWARKALIAAFTYALSVVILASVGAPQPFFNALVPTFGFLLSTMTFQLFKKWWIEKIYKK